MLPSLIFFLHDTEASTYGVLSGASEVFLGEALGALAKGGSKFLSKKLEGTVIGAMKNNASKAINEILGNSQTASAAAAIVKNMGKEAAEEYFQYALDPLMQNISFDGKDYTAKEMLTNAFSKEAFHSALLGALSSGTSQMTGVAANGVAKKSGLLSTENLNKLSDSDLHKVGDSITNAYAETVKADPNMKVSDAQIEAYKQQSKKNMGSRENAIAQILLKGAELKGMIGGLIEKGKVAGLVNGGDGGEATAKNKALQGDGDGTIITDGSYIKNGKPNGRPELKGKAKKQFEIDVYNNSVRSDGILRDPNTNAIINWKPGQPRKGVVDFGHKSGMSYQEMFRKYRNREITLAELKEFQFNPNNFQLEVPSSNRSHKYE